MRERERERERETETESERDYERERQRERESQRDRGVQKELGPGAPSLKQHCLTESSLYRGGNQLSGLEERCSCI